GVYSSRRPIRWLRGLLERPGVTGSQRGAGGGALLALSASRITLCDVYRAIADRELFGLHRERPNPRCPVGRDIQALLTERFGEATNAVERTLARTTIGDMLDRVNRVPA